jgi:hypothetical protein
MILILERLNPDLCRTSLSGLFLGLDMRMDSQKWGAIG